MLLDSILRAHCYSVARRVFTPTWMLARLFQYHCVTAGVPRVEVSDDAVAECVEQCCGERYEPCYDVPELQETCAVVGLAVFSDSPLYPLWRRKAVFAENSKKRKSSTADDVAKKSKKRCPSKYLSHEAIQAIRLLATDVSPAATTSKFVARAVVAVGGTAQHRKDSSESGHVMYKGIEV